MPNRILRDTALDSDRIASIDEGSEVLFYRLLMLADDFGRFDGRVAVIRARAFALRISIDGTKKGITDTEIERRLIQLDTAGLINRYIVDTKPYLEIPRFGQRQRAEKSKFPSISQADVRQLPVNGQASAPVVEDVDVIRSRKKPGAEHLAMFDEFWKVYPRKENKRKALAEWSKITILNGDFEFIMTGLKRACESTDWRKDDGKFIPHPSTWLHNKRWEDQPRQPLEPENRMGKFVI